MENDELTKLLRKNIEVSEKSLSILKKIHRQSIYKRIFSTLKFLVIAALVVYGFIQIQPYIEGFLKLYQKAGQLNEQLDKVPDLSNIKLPSP